MDTDQVAVARADNTTVRMDMLELLEGLLTSLLVDATTLSGNGVNSNLAVLNPFTAALQTKLADIEADATADQTAAEIVALLEALTGNARLDASAALRLIADALDTELGQHHLAHGRRRHRNVHMAGLDGHARCLRHGGPSIGGQHG